MQLHRLKLVNFRLHADTDLVFGPGVTAVVGPNGAGKTTLLEAIAWAIYGTPAARGSRDSIRRNNAGPRTSVRVELAFSFGGHEYTLVRSLRDAQLFQDNGPSPIAVTQQTVTQKMVQLFGMSRTEFFNTYFTGQKELAVMASMGPTDRAKFLSRLMGYERLKLAQDRLRSTRSSLRGEIQGLEQVIESAQILEQDQLEVEDRMKEARARERRSTKALREARNEMDCVEPQWKKISALRESIQSLQGERSMAEAQVREARREFDRLDRELAEAIRARDELAKMREQLEQVDALREEFDRLDREAHSAGRRRTLTGQLDEIVAQLDAAERQLGDLGGDEDIVANARNALSNMHTLLHDTKASEEERHASWVNDRAHAKNKHTALQDDFRELQKHKQGLIDAGPEGSCPTCARPLGSEFELVLERVGRQLEEVESSGKFYRQRVEQLEAEPAELKAAQRDHTEAEGQLERAAQELADAEAQLRERKRAQDEHKRLCGRKEQVTAELATLPDSYDVKRHDALRFELRELEPKIKRAAELKVRAERAESLVQEAEGAERVASEREARAKQLGDAIDASGFSEATYLDLRKRFKSWEAALRDAELKAARIQGDIKAAEAARAAVQRRVRERASRLKTLEALKKRHTLHDELDAALESLRAELNARLRPDLAELASVLLSDLTDGRYSELELDEQYRLTMVEEGMPKAVISGGEEDVANLVLRLAISQMVSERAGQPLSLLIFDEIFGSLDDDRRRSVVELLRNLGNRFPQVVLITHVESVKDGADRVLRVALDPEAGAAIIREDEEAVAPEDAAA